MLDNRYDLPSILAFYPVQWKPGAAVGHPIVGGFSGSLVWRLPSAGGDLCLRRWPAEYSDANRLRGIHRVLGGVFEAGFRRVPVPVKTAVGDTVAGHGGHLWQLEPWLPGKADRGGAPFRPTSELRIEAALATLAEFHRAVAAEPSNRLPNGQAPGIVKRQARISELLHGELERLEAGITTGRDTWPELADRAPVVLKLFKMFAADVAERLAWAAKQAVPIGPAIRDIHREHVLFEGDEVSGMVDFGAMQPDSVAADIARLLGSMAGDDPALWERGLQAYEKLRPLAEDERRLVRVYNESEGPLAGMNWLWWVFVDGRQFANRPGVLARLDEIVARLVTRMDRKSAGADISV